MIRFCEYKYKNELYRLTGWTTKHIFISDETGSNSVLKIKEFEKFEFHSKREVVKPVRRRKNQARPVIMFTDGVETGRYISALEASIATCLSTNYIYLSCIDSVKHPKPITFKYDDYKQNVYAIFKDGKEILKSNNKGKCVAILKSNHKVLNEMLEGKIVNGYKAVIL